MSEAKRLFEVWKLEGLTFDKIMAKLKEYARGKKLNDEASHGKPAVDMNWCQEGEETKDAGGDDGEDENGTVNKVGPVRCKYRRKFGHTADNCPKAKAKRV